MPSAPAVLLQTLSLFTLNLITATSAEPIPTVFVGDSISCDCGGVEGRWSLNGVDINVTASQIQDTISVVNGSFNYDGRLDCDSGGNPCEFKALGLLGVSPSPSNCSSVDNTTNTCTVTAAVGSSLTLCVDFTHYPSDAPRFAEIAATVWRRSDTREWFWYCNYGSCTKNLNSYSMNISISSSGACAHVESVQKNNSLLLFFRGDPHPVGKHLELHRQAGLFHDVTFSIQVPRTSSSVPSPTASVSSVLPSSSVTTTIPKDSVTSTDPSTMNKVEIAIGIIVSAFIIAVVVFSIVVLAVVFFRRKKATYCLKSQSDDSILDPDLQQSSTNEGRTRPSELQIQRFNVASSPVTYQSTPQASSQRPLLYQDQNGPQMSLPPPPPYSLTVNHTNGHVPQPPSHTHPHVVQNGSAPYPRYVVPNQELGGGSQRDSLLELDDIDASPEVHV